MDRKDEIIRLQMDVINQMTRSNLNRIADDLWGSPVPAAEPRKTEIMPEKTAEKAQEKAPQQAEKEEKPETIEELKAELQTYIGLEEVKKEVDTLINLVTIQKLRKENGLPTNDLSLHMVFSGNPGTGKTMIARLMARIYKSLGILSKGQLVEVDRSGLVAGYIGQTALKTGKVIESAMGGVLFIDEAYALNGGTESDYGQEAIETLLKAMEDHRDDLVVIVAGYDELMEEFVHSNPGLESRFNRFLHFPDYDQEEMLAIFRMRCDKSCYTLAEDAEESLKQLLLKESSDDPQSFGNARGVRNIFERILVQQANRLAAMEQVTKEDLMLLTKDDVLAVEQGENE